MTPYRPEDDPDLDLVLDLQRGAQVDQSFTRLQERYVRRLSAAFASRGYSPDEREDLIQERLARVYENINAYRWECRFSSWVLTIAENIHRNEVRRRQARMRRGQGISWESAFEDHLLALADHRPGRGSSVPGPLASVLSQERLAALGKAVGKLPPQMRECVMLRAQELKLREVATLLKVSVGTVKAHLFHGRERLRKDLFDFFGEAGF